MGDRFYYENGGDLNTRFSLEQLNEIRKTSMARILCNTLDLLTRIQKRAFEPSSTSDGVSVNPNEMVKCTNLDTMDLSKWSDEKLSANNNNAAAAAATTTAATDPTNVDS
jgi:peroxidase